MNWQNIITKNIGDRLNEMTEQIQEMSTAKELVEDLISNIERDISSTTSPEKKYSANIVNLRLTYFKKELQAILQKLS